MSSGPNCSRPAAFASVSAASSARFARGVNGRGRPAIHGSSPSPMRRGDLLARRLVVEATDPALQYREHQVLGADVVVLQRVGLLLGLDHDLLGAVVEPGHEELAAPAAAPAAALPAAAAEGRHGHPDRALDDLVDPLVRQLERLGDLAQRAAGGVELLDRVVVVHACVCGLALEVDETLPHVSRLGQNLFV